MTEPTCPFCRPARDRFFHQAPLVCGIWDRFPVSDGHALLVTHRHVATWFDATAEEQQALLEGIKTARTQILRRFKPDGFNIGINVGAAGGQTVPHLHVHVIPRYVGDVPDPRGGVRHVIPYRANYLRADPAGVEMLLSTPHSRSLVRGGIDPLLPHLRADLDRAAAADLAVAFIRESGLDLIIEHLRDLLDRGGRLRILTGDYLGVTEPRALRKLMDLSGRMRLRVFEASAVSFHPKAYIVYRPNGSGTAYIGSSNLSASALNEGIEWNYRTVTTADAAGFHDVVAAFESLMVHPSTRNIDAAWVDSYQARRRVAPVAVVAAESKPEAPKPPPQPHTVQMEAMSALEATRAAGNASGLVVMATGLGKTWLSAFDSNRSQYERILFVAHREEILTQAMHTFRRVRPEAVMGRYNGEEKASHADVLFASIQTLGRQQHLDAFARDAFDYIIVDEFHHASAPTYRKLIDHFTPAFLLGLTATPERMDGGDLMALCGENLVYRCDLFEGIRRELLCPFQYFGVPDIVDYTNIPWRSNRFDEEALTTAVATKARAQNALEQHRLRAGKRTLAFCCSQRHADFMADYFRAAGLRAVAVHAGAASAPRAASLEALETGHLDVVFAVDMFNEGVDLPHVDTVMMLRPTESGILWLQQFGRGLRRAEGKNELRVIDYIGNHRVFLLKPRTLLGIGPSDREMEQALNLLLERKTALPPGCGVTYDLEAIDMLRSMLRLRAWRDANVVEAYYRDFRDRHGQRPTATEALHDGYNPRVARRVDGSWLKFVARMGDMDSGHRQALDEAGPFVDALEITPMTKSFKMLMLLALLNLDALPGRCGIRDLAHEFRRLAERSAVLRKDVGAAIENDDTLIKLLRENPVNAWTSGRGTQGHVFFESDDEGVQSLFKVSPAARSALQEMAREIADWRLAEYLQRPNLDEMLAPIVCSVAQTNGRPILFLPDPRPIEVPTGWVPMTIDGHVLQVNVVKVAINVIRDSNSNENLLPKIMRRWFGPDAGMPGTTFRVELRQIDGTWEMRPLLSHHRADMAEPWRQYSREQIPGLFGLTFSTAVWNQGFVVQPHHLFLLVTLEKNDLAADFQYEDRFLSPELFQWQSQNRTRRDSKHGTLIKEHRERATAAHLFVRRHKKTANRAAPFVYCGDVSFESWSGDSPITVKWHLANPVPEHLRTALNVPTTA